MKYLLGFGFLAGEDKDESRQLHLIVRWNGAG
jgi:hypothetical protein